MGEDSGVSVIRTRVSGNQRFTNQPATIQSESMMGGSESREIFDSREISESFDFVTGQKRVKKLQDDSV